MLMSKNDNVRFFVIPKNKKKIKNQPSLIIAGEITHGVRTKLETNKFKWWIKEAIEIGGKVSGTINRDEGHFLEYLGFTSPEIIQGGGGAAGLTGSDRSVE